MSENFRVLVVDESAKRRHAFRVAFSPTGWEFRCVPPEMAHETSKLLKPHATLVAYEREKNSVGAVLRTRNSVEVLPPQAVDPVTRADEVTEASKELAAIVRAAWAT